MQKLATLTVIALLGAIPLSGQTLDLRVGTTRHEKTGFAAGLFTDRPVGPQAMRLGAYWMQVTHTSWSKGFIELPCCCSSDCHGWRCAERPSVYWPFPGYCTAMLDADC